MNTYLSASLAADRRRTLVADAVTFRQARAARRFVRRARSGGEAPRPAVRSHRSNPFSAFAQWHAAGQL